jgi:alkanesulfonate monooxygenase SsuD/methylene tetrahydromethanopterin reductase-like flavin-dependent oxidoreductase (luciferase family)
MKYGITLPYNAARQVADTAVLAENSGWDGLFLGDAIWCFDPMIALAASAMLTTRIRLGTLVTPVPLRIPWKLASESIALDHLSGGRVTLSLATGATWMGWQAFPDEITDTKARAEMLGEMIDILTLLYQRKQFDYDGKHFHLKLTLMDTMHYPPMPVQQPRIPLWVVGVWPRKTSIARAMKGDGLIPHKINAEGKFEDVTPADLREMKAYVEAHRGLDTPFDYIIEGQTGGLEPAQAREKLGPWEEAGTTWWIESMWGKSEEEILARVRQGPPGGG